MPHLRCPQCGAINDTNAPDYPFCIGCQDNLAKCGHCRWFDREALLCLSPAAAGVFDSAPDATPPCDQHVPGETVMVQSRGYVPFAVLGAVVALLVLVYAIVLVRQPAVPVEKLNWTVEPSALTAAVGVPYVLTVEVQNPADRVVGGIRIQISKASLQSFRLVRAMPKEDAREQQRGEWLALIYSPLQKRETRSIDLHLLPTAVGVHHFAVRLVSSGRNYHGMTDLPITVAERPPAEGTHGETGRRAIG